jgi:DNA-binding transcriptional regulator YiaG
MHWSKRREMSPLEFRQHIEHFGVSKSAMARLLGVSNRTARRYALGEASIPPAQVLLIRALFAAAMLRKWMYFPPYEKGEY